MECELLIATRDEDSPLPLRPLAATFVATAVVAQAHPGHEGHDLTWILAPGIWRRIRSRRWVGALVLVAGVGVPRGWRAPAPRSSAQSSGSGESAGVRVYADRTRAAENAARESCAHRATPAADAPHRGRRISGSSRRAEAHSPRPTARRRVAPRRGAPRRIRWAAGGMRTALANTLPALTRRVRRVRPAIRRFGRSVRAG